MKLTNKNTQPTSIFSNFAYILFMLFAVTRPISLIDIGIPFFLDFYAIVFGYIFLFYILLKFNNIIIDRTSVLILIFLFFSSVSFVWGTELREFIKLIVPFVFFFVTRLLFITNRHVDNFFLLYNIGYIIPLLTSTAFVILGFNIQLIEFRNQVPRHAGAYFGAHTLAYQMLSYSFIFCYNIFLSGGVSKLNKYISIPMYLLSIFCLYQSHTRTVFIGFLIFWAVFVFGIKKRYFMLFLIIFLTSGVFFSSHISKIFLKDTQDANLKVATSGRSEIWKNYIDDFKKSSVPEKIVGKGIGWTLPGPGFHSDWLRLLVQNGIVGLIVFISISVSIMYDIYKCHNKKVKYFFGSIFISMMIIMIGSNNLISFFEVSILFWIFMGFFYNLKGIIQHNEAK